MNSHNYLLREKVARVSGRTWSSEGDEEETGGEGEEWQELRTYCFWGGRVRGDEPREVREEGE